jgi:two-component system, NtrC family, sensor histidine kinase PilS
MRTPFRVSDEQLRLVFDRRRFVRWLYGARMAVVSLVFLSSWGRRDQLDPLDFRIAALALGVALVVTAASLWRSEGAQAPPDDSFLYAQHFFDAFLVTAIVHVTGGELSQFAALYILVNTSAALLLPIGGSLLLAVLGCVLYAADVLLLSGVDMSVGLGQQLAVFFLVAIGTGVIGSRLQQMSAASQGLARELSQVRLQAGDILHNIGSAVLTVDGQMGLLYANPAASELLGVDLEERIGWDLGPLLRAVAPGLAEAIAQAADAPQGTVRRRQEAQLSLRGRKVPLGFSTTTGGLVGAEGLGGAAPRTVTAIVQDISDQRALEESRSRAERLEAVAELSASLAHEIKNPLASIRSAVEQLGGAATATPDERTLGRLIVRESDRLSRLLSEFLDFARTRVTTVAAIDLTAIVRGAAGLAAEHPSRAPGVRVEVRAPTDPLLIDGDEDLVHRAVFNLVLNAVQASPSDGTVVVAVEPPEGLPLPPVARSLDEVVQVRVSDTGAGLPDEVRARLFVPFTTTRPGGSGLGLSVVQRAVEAHRGLVLVESSVDGTTVRLLFPRRQATAPAAAGGPA